MVPELIFFAKILEFRTFLMGTGTGIGNFSFFLVVSEKNCTGKSLGTGIGKIWYRKKSRNRYRKNLSPVSVKFSIRKSHGTSIGKIWYQKTVSVSYCHITVSSYHPLSTTTMAHLVLATSPLSTASISISIYQSYITCPLSPISSTWCWRHPPSRQQGGTSSQER